MTLNMPVFVDWIITVLVVALVASYIWQLVTLMRQPAEGRPRTAVYDRYGELIDTVENPDYHIIPVEDELD